MAGQTYLRTHDLAAEHLSIDLGEAAIGIHGLILDGQDRGAVTLVKQGGLSVLLMHLHAGATLAEHSALGTTTVQVVSGHVHVRIGDETLDVPAGRLIVFDGRVRHGVEAVEGSTLLLTLAQPQA